MAVENPKEEPSPQILLTIRFSASIPDLDIGISSPENTTAAGLKQLIRARLPPELSERRLRLIYAGRGLEDEISLAVALKLNPLGLGNGRNNLTHGRIEGVNGNGDIGGSGGCDKVDNDNDPEEDIALDSKRKEGKRKGKAAIRDPPLPHLYVHCSIGDIVLSATDLSAEADLSSIETIQQREATWADKRGTNGHTTTAKSIQSRLFHSSSTTLTPQVVQDEESQTTPAARGFDRLLSAGFTSTEVTALRSQFLALLSVSHTPDTMPSGPELRELEDRWLDEGSGAMGAHAGGGGTGLGGPFSSDDDGGFGTGSHGALDDMLWGAVMGFFWPVGCAMWLRREEGIWSWRKGLAVFVGIVVNILFGAMRVMN